MRLLRVTNRPGVYKDKPGCCIYCGTLDDPNPDLREEHIIPTALEGRLRFPYASCPECEAITSAIEGHVIGRSFGDSRAPAGMKRGRKRKWPKKFVVHVNRKATTRTIGAWGRDDKKEDFEEVEVDVENHPGPMVMPNFPVAGFFTRAEPNDSDFCPVSLYIAVPEDFRQRVNKLGGSVAVGQSVRTETFGRFIAKIAHSFAAAEIGIGNFIPFLTRAIRGQRPMYLSQYIGGHVPNFPIEPTNQVHKLEIYRFNSDSHPYVLVARVQLLAAHGFPTYDVVVGAVTRATRLPL
ncbi:MAG: hypothetical protein WB760_22395 [Xanthobacteraceae bacterium]